MYPKIFITGITGFVDNHTAVALLKKHPAYDIVGLVRKDEQAKISLRNEVYT